MSNNKDNINPDHYKTGGLEVYDILKAKLTPAELLGFCKGNVLKYTFRSNLKGGLEDLKKAVWYANEGVKAYEALGEEKIKLDNLTEKERTGYIYDADELECLNKRILPRKNNID